MTKKVQFPVRQYFKRFHSKIRNGIKIFFVVGNRHIGRIRDFHLVFCQQSSIFHVHIVNLDSMFIAFTHRIG